MNKTKLSILYNTKTHVVEDTLINNQLSSIKPTTDIVRLECSDALYSYIINVTPNIKMLYDLNSIASGFSMEDIRLYTDTFGKIDFSNLSEYESDIWSKLFAIGSNEVITQAELFLLAWPNYKKINKISASNKKYKDNQKIICLVGNRQVGKDTFANNATTIGNIKRLAIADALKVELNELIKPKMGIDLFNCSAKEKELVRPIMISYGCAMREINPNYWINTIIQSIHTALNNGESVVITDARFLNELQKIYSLFGSDMVKTVAISNLNAPQPTEEEKKNWPIISSCADYQFVWGGNNSKQICMKVKAMLEMIGII